MADLTLELPDYRVSDLPDTVRRLYDHAGALTEQLRYVLMHLDGDNIPALGGLQEQLADAEGNLSVLSQTAAALLARVENAEGGLASVILTAEALGTRIESAEGGISTLTQTADALTTRVQNAEGSISTVQQTANGLSSTVSDLSGKYSKLQQTVDGFDLTGLVTFSDLLDADVTEISGDCITTGTIALKRLDISNNYGSLEISSGSTGVQGTVGPCLTGPDADVYFIVTNAACRMTADGNHFYVSPDRIDATEDITVSSDERVKHSIVHDVADRYEAVYRALRPARFKYDHGKSDRYHTGFIAQEVEQAIADSGLTNQDLAALVHGSEAEGGLYAIRYGELIALNTAMIQRLMARVDALEQNGGNE